MHKKKNQKTTTNPVAQRQADTSLVKKPKPTQAQPILLKEEGKIKLIKNHQTNKLINYINHER